MLNSKFMRNWRQFLSFLLHISLKKVETHNVRSFIYHKALKVLNSNTLCCLHAIHFIWYLVWKDVVLFSYAMIALNFLLLCAFIIRVLDADYCIFMYMHEYIERCLMSIKPTKESKKEWENSCQSIEPYVYSETDQKFHCIK